MSKTAVMIDGGFYLRRAHSLWGDKTPRDRADELQRYVFKHIDKKDGPYERELYRVFYYDCEPIADTVYHPIRGNVNLRREPHYGWCLAFFEELKRKRKFALRMGAISKTGREYTLSSDKLKKLVKGKISASELQEGDFHPRWTQKGVDMKLGLDISSLAYEGIVSQIVLISGDSDFVPAAKVARRKGIDFVLDPMGANISDELFEHIDGMESFIREDPQRGHGGKGTP